MELGQFVVTLKNGRPIGVNDPEFAEKLPITKEAIDRLSGDDDVFHAIGALLTAVLQLEARGIEFEDDAPGTPQAE